MRKNKMRENGMRRRRVGNYLKEYPHVYEAFRKVIWIKNVEIEVAIVYSTVMVFIALPLLLLTVLSGDDFEVFLMIDAILLTVLVIYIFALFKEFKREGMISLTELELMEKDLTGGKEKVGNWGYSTKESIIIGFYRIPRKGLNAVYQGKSFCRIGRNRGHEYELKFYYEDGTHLSAWLRKDPEASDEKNFAQLIRKYDDSVKIYRYQKMSSFMGSNGMNYPFERLKVEVPYVRKEIMDELNMLCSGNSFWKLEAKSENECNDNKEVELTIRGTVMTWLIYIAGICLCICIFILFYFTPLQSEAMWLLEISFSDAGVLFYLLVPFLVMCGAEFCWYLCFFKNARKITEKAIKVLYEGTF